MLAHLYQYLEGERLLRQLESVYRSWKASNAAFPSASLPVIRITMRSKGWVISDKFLIFNWLMIAERILEACEVFTQKQLFWNTSSLSRWSAILWQLTLLFLAAP